jgi:hypothetical protein
MNKLKAVMLVLGRVGEGVDFIFKEIIIPTLAFAFIGLAMCSGCNLMYHRIFGPRGISEAIEVIGRSHRQNRPRVDGVWVSPRIEELIRKHEKARIARQKEKWRVAPVVETRVMEPKEEPKIEPKKIEEKAKPKEEEKVVPKTEPAEKPKVEPKVEPKKIEEKAKPKVEPKVAEKPKTEPKAEKKVVSSVRLAEFLCAKNCWTKSKAVDLGIAPRRYEVERVKLLKTTAAIVDDFLSPESQEGLLAFLSTPAGAEWLKQSRQLMPKLDREYDLYQGGMLREMYENGIKKGGAK